MAFVVPTVTAENPHQYREQMERIAPFVTKVHIDFMDGTLAPTKSPDINQAWWPHFMQADLHVMFEDPEPHLPELIKLNPRLVIVHAEAKGNFLSIAKTLHDHNIKAGVALLPGTELDTIKLALDHIDHVLIFSGDLGHFGGKVDLSLLSKVKELKKLKPNLIIGWDGGISPENIRQLADGGVDVMNVGGYIQRAESPKENFEQLQNLLK